MNSKVFIDGEAGTTGLQIRKRLEAREDIALLTIDPDKRKDLEERKRLLNEADVVILCLPDEAAKESVSLIENDETRVIDASTAHRVAEGWTYGFPEMTAGHADVVAGSKRVANIGCYAVGSVSILRPLTESGLLPESYPVTINAVSGYSGGGKALINRYEDPNSPFWLYGLTWKHKHLPEIVKHGGLASTPVFMPSVGKFAQGMLVSIPLHLDQLTGAPGPEALQALYEAHYAGERFVKVAPAEEVAAMDRLHAEAANDTNDLRLHVFHDMHEGLAVVTALLDNLGKGASGSAVQNLNLMIGADPATSLA